MSKNQIIIGVAVLFLVMVVGVFVIAKSGGEKQTIEEPLKLNTENSEPEQSAVAESSTNSATGSNQVNEFTVTGSSYKFEPAILTVKAGDKVKITFKNSGGIHDFVIDEFNVKTDTISDGKSTTVEFTADKTGTFEYYCSVGNHRKMGMKGTITVQ